jgi:hypothetical protein
VTLYQQASEDDREETDTVWLELSFSRCHLTHGPLSRNMSHVGVRAELFGTGGSDRTFSPLLTGREK